MDSILLVSDRLGQEYKRTVDHLNIWGREASFLLISAILVIPADVSVSAPSMSSRAVRSFSLLLVSASPKCRFSLVWQCIFLQWPGKRTAVCTACHSWCQLYCLLAREGLEKCQAILTFSKTNLWPVGSVQGSELVSFLPSGVCSTWSNTHFRFLTLAAVCTWRGVNKAHVADESLKWLLNWSK